MFSILIKLRTGEVPRGEHVLCQPQGVCGRGTVSLHIEPQNERRALPLPLGSLYFGIRSPCWLLTPPSWFCLLPTPSQGVLNFVQYKFSHLAPRERQTMFELSKMFLLCLNYWKLETPAQFRQRSQAEDVATYKVNYTR